MLDGTRTPQLGPDRSALGPLTATAKILHAHGLTDPAPGTYGLINFDLVMMNDVSGAVAMPAFEATGAARVFDPARVALVADHFVPAKDTQTAGMIAALRTFARTYEIDNYWEVGATPEAGIEHTLLAEQGLIWPGSIICGGDSHTCTYGAFGALGIGVGSSDVASAMALGEVWVKSPEVISARYRGTPAPLCTGKDLILAFIGQVGIDGATYASIEFSGPAVTALDMDGRMALCNMAVEAGAKACLVEPDAVTRAYYRDRQLGELTSETVRADVDAVFDQVVDIDVNGLGCLVACPPNPGVVRSINDLPQSIHVDQVYVGNCANGTISDLRQLARVLKGRSVAAGTRLIVVPATQRIYRQAVAEGIVDTVLSAGGMMSPPTCGACFGGHMGILSAGETAVATTNRNFTGRMGHRTAEIYLANAYVAGAAAVTGELTDPHTLL
jgi:3-isopropylmalate/(R)-2-methylmalate dehydratase large subunit